MSSDNASTSPRRRPARTVPRPAGARRTGPLWGGLALLIALPVSLWLSGLRPTRVFSKTGPTLPTLVIDRGDIDLFVVESGAMESANNETVKCRVEALIGAVGAQNAGGMAGGRGGAGGAGGRPGMGGAPGACPAGPAPAGTGGRAGQPIGLRGRRSPPAGRPAAGPGLAP